MTDQIHQLERSHAKAAGLAHHRVERRRIGRAFGKQAPAFGVERPRASVDDEAGCRHRVHRRLPTLPPSRRSSAATASSVASPLTTSTSGMSGAGLKKCMPTTRDGWFKPAASAVIESDDVFDAMIVSQER